MVVRDQSSARGDCNNSDKVHLKDGILAKMGCIPIIPYQQ